MITNQYSHGWCVKIIIMKIIDSPIKKTDLKSCQNQIDNIAVKGVVDVEKELLAIDAEFHADLEQFLLQNGSNQHDLWGINLYFEEDDLDDFLEFDSMINLRPSQNNRSRGIDSPELREKIQKVVTKWVK